MDATALLDFNAAQRRGTNLDVALPHEHGHSEGNCWMGIPRACSLRYQRWDMRDKTKHDPVPRRVINSYHHMIP